MNHERIDFEGSRSGHHEEARTVFNVVVVYDARSAAGRAMDVLGGLVRQFGDDFEFRCDLLRFDVLDMPPVREAAARAGDAADLIILSASGDAELPTPVTRWLNWCVEGKTPGSAALVALLGSRHRLGDVQGRTRHILQSAADRGGLDFFLHEVDLPPASPLFRAAQIEERAKTISPVLHGILHRSGRPPRPRTQG